MKKNKSKINFSLLGLSLFLLFTFTFSSHVFCFHNVSNVSSSVTSKSIDTKVSKNNNDLSSGTFIGEVEEVEENETEDHSLAHHLPVLSSFYTSILHTQESNNSLHTYSHLKFSLCGTPVFIKNCTFLI